MTHCPTNQTTPQARLGILMLDTQFPRIKGDIGHADSFAFPVRYKIVTGASPDQAVLQGAKGLLPDFIAAGHELVAEGVTAISTSCGFLSLFQKELTAALPVPVLTSALLQVPLVNALLPVGMRAGILTISAASLTPAHLMAAGVPTGTPIGGVAKDCEFAQAILNDRAHMDLAQAKADNIAAAKALKAAHPDLGAIILECTNMGPYAADIQRATKVPVFSIIDLLTWFHAGFLPYRKS